ncbi:MAG: PTS sugar transporter subunit IIC [Lachnospiraceae bacterium]|nr:PTS sugar transporter subunit IIC [Lachnospiraceae bacterium]MDY5742356.1 PTS sugar transporter subunit IIC [Lachnospiraceae bacterium]
MKKYLNRIFIDGLTGMAHGLFATLIIGTIMMQLGGLIGGQYGHFIVVIGKMATLLTGAGIGVGLAGRLGEPTFVVIGSAVAGMVGAYATPILKGSLMVDGTIRYAGPGEPLGSFIAAFAAIEIGRLIAGKTKLDILLTPLVTIAGGSVVGLLIGPPINRFMALLGELINYGTTYQPFLMGIIVSVLMGMILTLPISSAALGIVLQLSGLAAGAATIGCCAQMIGFAVASFRENGISGLITQGIGTSMVQVPNIVRKPVIWLPPILASAILGPLSTMIFKMTNAPAGSGMGTSGLVGQIMTFRDMAGKIPTNQLWLYVILLHFLLPATLTLVFSELFRKLGWIKTGDMKLA